MRIAVVGATGLVGQKILDVLEERNFPVSDLYPVASERSVGKEVAFKGNKYKVISMEDAIQIKPQIAIFSAGGSTSLKWAPEFAKVGTTVVDNSSAWRMDESKKLVVPEINACELTKEDKIIANPNCSTIQMVVALAPLHKKYKIERLVVSTYQSITGTGVKAVQQFEDERAGLDGEKAYPHEIDKNCLPHCDVFTDNGYTKEEMKLVNETRKILKDDSIRVTATAVRVPVVGGHSESVNIEFANDFEVEELKQLLSETDGVIVQDNLDENEYPMPKYSHERDEVFVGRIRRDYSNPNSVNMWVVADNLRKGAATNAVQIAEYLAKHELV
ncbi:aspartate-semialdehyde dehydrogenase [Marinifilum caeruleilacunae]|uniref:Aspartate-semialdehyde dehydrogenase n=1 Tax=Marinifilum caeruleilacunae TaxID=2499076 RepID=A0ABX1WXE8_9BACT|nr:aspartate-semialdehyde dehydrogenase [Marinifilum caeruleilacunae]NOU60601.1 aspartate-semialdehyde dehydrogenase [Marinifilum caeruleilacunae]